MFCLFFVFLGGFYCFFSPSLRWNSVVCLQRPNIQKVICCLVSVALCTINSLQQCPETHILPSDSSHNRGKTQSRRLSNNQLFMHFSQSGSLHIYAAEAARSILPQLSLATKNFSLAIKNVICSPAQSHFHQAIKAHRDCVLLISCAVRQKRIVCVCVCVRVSKTYSLF